MRKRRRRSRRRRRRRRRRRWRIVYMLTAGSVIAKHDRMLPSKSGSNHLFWRERERGTEKERERYK